MFIVHGTKKFRDRVNGQEPESAEHPTTALGNWYATVLFTRPQAALFVNEFTLMPMLVHLAPAATVIERFPSAAAAVFGRLGLNEAFIRSEGQEMAEHRLTKTQIRSLLGSMNEFAFMAKVYCDEDGGYDPVDLSLKLSEVPCGPLFPRQVSPDRELAAFVVECWG